jgi:hypothetical protein
LRQRSKRRPLCDFCARGADIATRVFYTDDRPAGIKKLNVLTGLSVNALSDLSGGLLKKIE